MAIGQTHSSRCSQGIPSSSLHYLPVPLEFQHGGDQQKVNSMEQAQSYEDNVRIEKADDRFRWKRVQVRFNKSHNYCIACLI